MKIIAVDDNQADLHKLTEAIREVCSEGVLSSFSSMDDAISYIDTYTLQIAFMESVIEGKSVFEHSKQLQRGISETNIIFVTDNNCFAAESHFVRASGYILKPVTPEAIAKELKNLRYPLSNDEIEREEQCLMIKTKKSEMAIPYTEIYYAEYEKGKIQFYVSYMESLIEEASQERFDKAIAPLMENAKFIRISKTIIVNMEWVKEITDDSFVMYMENKIKIPRSEYTEAKARYSDYILRYGRSEIFDMQ